jgi:tRNA A37 threonylcarbamoyladenosine dehydratase
VGHLTLIDLDHVALSNMNRQIHALETTLGQAKVQACLERIALINPSCSVTAIDEFVSPENVARLLGGAGFDFVVDASDDVKAKVAIAVFCRERGIALVSIGAAGGQRDATRVRVADLAHTQHEPLLARVRKRLRSQHGFSRNLKARFGIAAVYSDEPVANPWQTAATVDLQPVADGAPPDRADSAGPSLDAPSRAAGGATGLNCAGFGSSVAVTAVFGMVAAGFVLEELARRLESAAGS